ncbi:MAG TPA: J domain-containing protein [Acidimicrobiales bacterium]|nr:J domain-containing protein [Acidimicrobiales bacterium]
MAAGSVPPDWYGILGVDPSASDAEIGRAFRALARRFHPDVGPDSSHGNFSDVARAWEVLGNPARRADYDRTRAGMPGGGVRIPVRRWAGEPDGPASMAASQPTGAEPEEVEVAVSFAESIAGTVAKIRLPAASVCVSCSGTGRVSAGACSSCGGDGGHRRQSGSITINRVCPDCAGTGARPPRPCRACQGRGWAESARELSVRVPGGVTEGSRLRLRSASGEAAGFARVRVGPDPWFSRAGRDLVLRLPLGLGEAALGTVVVVQLPDGPAEVTVPPGTGSGTRLRVPGRGVPGGERGDLVASVEVVVPHAPNAAERAALEALAAVERSPRDPSWPAARGPSANGRAPKPSHAEHEPQNESRA